MKKSEAVDRVTEARLGKGVSWKQIAEAIDRPVVWTVTALLGNHPVPEDAARIVGDLLELDDETTAALVAQPYRVADPALASDPTIYRFHEAINVYGPALKELIHEEFGDGIMSAINFSIDFSRRPHPDGDRVVVTFDGKFLPYQWTS